MRIKLILFFIIVFGLMVFPVLGFMPAFAKASAGELAQTVIETPESKPVILYFFWGDGCLHCAKEEVFLEKLKEEYPNLEVRDYEVWNNRENYRILKKIVDEVGLEKAGIPLTIIGNQVVSGYYNDEVTGKEIREIVEEHSLVGCTDVVGGIIKNEDSTCVHECEGDPECEHGCGCEVDKKKELPDEITLPIFGTVKTKDLSLPILTVVIAALDGFNPCAMWVLLFLISLLVNMPNKKRMWILGTAFIGASALVYFLFLTAWLNLFLFLGFIFWVRLVVGVIAVGSGVYHLREYWVNKDGTCKVSGGEKRQRIFEKLRRVTQMKSFWIALGGIIILAFAVNLVELVCSAGLPAVYTNVLSLSGLAVWQYYAYLLLYILIFMADDLLIFFIAMKTLQMTGLSHKYSRVSNLVGGIIIFILGLLLLFKPGWLMFG